MKQEILGTYPFARVLLKPLQGSSESQADALYLQKRIGAFEVQVISKQGGRVSKGTVFTKLGTRRWPSSEEVLGKLGEFMPKCTLVVRVKDQRGNPQINLEEERDLAGKEKQRRVLDGDDDEPKSKFAGLSVRLTPLHTKRVLSANRESHEYSSNFMAPTTPNGVLHSQRSVPGRPLTGISQRPLSSHTTLSIGTSLRTIEARPSSVSRRPKTKGRETVQETNEKGVALFKAMPVESYLVEVRENNNFQRASKVVNLFEMMENNEPFLVELVLQEQTRAFCYLIVSDAASSAAITNAEILIAPIAEQPEFSALEFSKKKEGHYEFNVFPGEYLLRIIEEFGGEHTEHVHLDRGENVLRIAMNSLAPGGNGGQTNDLPKKGAAAGVRKGADSRPKSRYKNNGRSEENLHATGATYSLRVRLVDQVTGQPMRVPCNVYVLEDDSNAQVLFKGHSDEKGEATLELEEASNLRRVRIRCEHERFFPYEVLYIVNFHILNNNNLVLAMLPKAESPDEVTALVNGSMQGLTWHVIGPDEVDRSASQGEVSINGHMLRINIKSRRGIYRLFLRSTPAQSFADRRVTVVTSKGVCVLEPRLRDKETSQFWDIGLINAPSNKFIPIDIQTSNPILRDTHLRGYQKLLKYLRNSKSIDFVSLFGYTMKDRIDDGGDWILRRDRVLESLDKYGLENNADLSYVLKSTLKYKDGVEYCSINLIKQKFLTLLDEPGKPAAESDEFELVPEGAAFTKEDEEEIL
eukprot:TRINITY_DN10068_c0_g1_i1.p1 TRINITY_DN10068_c0_g1~~TRINITY_DN10068_c0_g1_i1.p1  ORF type:complete len:750 (+),score=189.51 TRINITY_DN10068_c0_g1_i1:111-2360(+)